MIRGGKKKEHFLRVSLFQSNLRKEIRNLPKILNFVKIIHYYSKVFTGVLSSDSAKKFGDSGNIAFIFAKYMLHSVTFFTAESPGLEFKLDCRHASVPAVPVRLTSQVLKSSS